MAEEVVKLVGMRELQEQLTELIKAVHPDKVEPILFEGAQTVAEAARAKAPLGPTGRLKRACIAKKMPRRGSNPAVSIAAVNYKVAPHMHLVEFGHGGPRPAPPHPFFRPAWDATKRQVKTKIVEDLRELVQKKVR